MPGTVSRLVAVVGDFVREKWRWVSVRQPGEGPLVFVANWQIGRMVQFPRRNSPAGKPFRNDKHSATPSTRWQNGTKQRMGKSRCNLYL